jgi:hypothetical protein
MNVGIGTKAAQFPEKEYINRILLAVRKSTLIAVVLYQKKKEAKGLLTHDITEFFASKKHDDIIALWVSIPVLILHVCPTLYKLLLYCTVVELVL